MRTPRTLNAIDMLKGQHDEVDELFSKIEDAGGEEKDELFQELADALAIHTSIEEKIFYPAVRANRTEDILLASLEEHLAIKRILADLLDMSAGDDMYDAKLEVLQEQVEHHVDDEEGDLFPRVKRIFDADTLEALGQEMLALTVELQQAGDARDAIPSEIEQTAPLE